VSLDSPAAVSEALAGERYLADQGLATAVFLAVSLEQPLLLEGEAGVGKTEVAKALAQALGARLIRLQCHEGIDVHHALYDWDYPRQLLHLRAEGEEQLYSERFLLRRPLLEAILATEPVVLLIDEVDRADDEFEAFLLELLSDFQVSIPELGTVRAERRPVVVMTSNRTRELHDALKRRCVYHWIDYPSRAKEIEIVRRKLPGLDERLAEQVVGFVQAVRREDLAKRPGVAETLDWAGALTELDQVALDPATLTDTLGVLLKYQDDIARMEGSRSAALLSEVRAELAAAP